MTGASAADIGVIAQALRVQLEERNLDHLERALGAPRDELSYLVLAVLHRAVAHPDAIREFTRRWRAEGLSAAVRHKLSSRSEKRRRGTLPVRVVSGVIADVTDTARSRFTTGIQRVARETLSRWWGDRDMVLIAWDHRARRFVTATAAETERVVLRPAAASAAEVIIPFRATLLLPEIAVDTERAIRLRSIAEFSGSHSVAIGFDCIPVTTAETAGPGMPGAFSKYLSTLARFSTVVPISTAAGDEYRGWRRMLRGAGIAGPEIIDLDLPFNAHPEPRLTAEFTRKKLQLGPEPVVLAVGSREPRKNHLALLHAAELNWRAGRRFSLVLVGGNSWETEEFDELAGRLVRRGRPLVMLSGVPDDVVWDLYALARFSVFCSLNEGFGLPVVESLSYGTPVITSTFGSMRQLGEGRGALLADPHDGVQIAERMRLLLESDDELEALRAQAASLPDSSWDDYASALWRLAQPRF